MRENTKKFDLSEVREAILSARGTYLMMADVDHLMHINDTLGSAAGDAALSALAGRIERSIPGEMIFFRTGNDDFTVLTRTDDPEATATAAARIIALSGEKVPYPGGTLQMTASLGIALIEPDIEDAQRAMDAAGRAMAQAKRLGRNRYEFDHGEASARAEILAAKGSYILLCDIDGLTKINDTLGYAAGDAAIAAVTARIAKSTGQSMRHFRTGGDAFTIVTGSGDRAVAEAVAQKILSLSGEPVACPGGTMQVSVSLGIAQVPQTLEGGAALAVDRADAALMAAKHAGRNTYRLYDDQSP